jgi:hypothetical protein
MQWVFRTAQPLSARNVSLVGPTSREERPILPLDSLPARKDIEGPTTSGQAGILVAKYLR